MEPTSVIKLQFLRHGVQGGREYTYYKPEGLALQVGDTVDTGMSLGVVTQVDVPVAEIEPFKDRAATIVGKVEQQAMEV